MNGPLRHGAPLRQGEEFSFGAETAAGLAFREVNVKEAFTIEDAEGTFFRASLKALDGRSGKAVAYERMRQSPESPAKITLVCAVLGRQRMILVTQKATELGCVRVVPVLTDHSVQAKDLDHEKPWAWPGQAKKAARQCRRSSVPEVWSTVPLAQALTAPFWTSASVRQYMDDRADDGADPFPSADAMPLERELVLVVGPEGGFSAREREALRQAGAGPVAFGARVLRAETAVIAGLAIVQHRFGDLRGAAR